MGSRLAPARREAEAPTIRRDSICTNHTSVAVRLTQVSQLTRTFARKCRDAVELQGKCCLKVFDDDRQLILVSSVELGAAAQHGR
jgi:hypothetical protein